MERVLGIGGCFVRSADPDALLAWYRDALGMDLGPYGLWHQDDGPTVVAAFPTDSEYLGDPTQRTMLGFRVRDLDAMLEQLRVLGARVDPQTQDMDGVGRFGWVTDPDGNRVELWQPA